MKLNRELAKQAFSKGICQDWGKELKETENIDHLLDMYVKGIDFCISNDYPTNDFIQRHFKGRMEHKGIHLDEELSIRNERKIIALGKCKGIAEVGDFTTCELFLKHSSELVLVVKDNAFVMVDMFDNSKLAIVAGDSSKVCVNRYGGDVKFEQHDSSYVKIKEMNQKTY